MNCRYDPAGRRFQILMLPDPQDSPSKQRELLVDYFVPPAVPCELLGPILRVLGRHPAVHGAAMPETAIDHDRESLTRKGDIHSNGANVRKANQVVDAKAQALGMES
ncbi:MAG: hypothetical protein QOE75_2767 [Solirubrobacterales bacterium]|nr:hypothetical protein [Solirubrobacterales bacterium]